MLMNDRAFKCENISFVYRLGNQMVHALNDVSLELPKGGIICLTGPSGSGKSTFLNILGLIEPCQSGALFLGNRDISRISEKQKNQLRRFELGFIFQSFHLIEVLRADENVEFFLARQNIPKKNRKQAVEQSLRAVGLWEHRSKYPPQMSGGQRQRVAIARALAKNPKIIIADEPTASVDQETGRQIMTILQNLSTEHGVTVVMASHDAMVLEFATTTVHLTDGKLSSSMSRESEMLHAV